MTVCTECGAELPEEAAEWCPACGAALAGRSGGSWDLAAAPAQGDEASFSGAGPSGPAGPSRPRRGGEPGEGGVEGRRLPAGRRLALMIVTALVVLAALGTGVYYLVGAFDSGGDPDGDEMVGLFPVMSGEQWGYMDVTGAMVIAPQFVFAGEFSEGLAPVVVDPDRGLYGYIDETGAQVIAPRFSEAYPFQEGLALVVEKTTRTFIDKTGESAFNLPELSWVEGYSQGRALAAIGMEDRMLFGYLDTTGAWAVEPRFAVAYDFTEDGLAAVQMEMDGAWGYIDTTGATVVTARYEWAAPFSEGLATVGSSVGNGFLYGYIDTEGRLVIDLRFSSAGDFHEGLAAVSEWDDTAARVSAPIGFIDTKGEWAIQPRFAVALDFSEGLAPVAEAPVGEQSPALFSWGYIDTSGAWVIEPQFEMAYPFSPGGLAKVVESSTWQGALDGYYVGASAEPWSSHLGIEYFNYIDRTGTMVRSREQGSR